MTTVSKRRVLLLTFAGSLGTSLIERGLYFFTHEALAFGQVANLSLALGWGVLYLIGAMLSHRLSVKLGERNLGVLAITAQVVLNLVMWWQPTAAVITGGFLTAALATGMMWPVVESYISSGLTPSRALRTIGYFNLTWSIAVPTALVLTGWILDAFDPAALLMAAASANLVVCALMMTLRVRPLHMDDDHPTRPPAAQLDRWSHLVRSARWTMLASYALLFLVAPLLPEIFADHGLSTGASAYASALLDLVRFLTFLGMILLPGWHDRSWPLVLALLLLPVGVAMILFGPAVWVVLLGEVLFGWASGASYFAALYYAQVIRNASVEAGGEHEGLIGAGFAIGPLMGLMAFGLTYLGLDPILAMTLSVAPFLILCGARAWTALPIRGAGATER